MIKWIKDQFSFDPIIPQVEEAAPEPDPPRRIDPAEKLSNGRHAQALLDDPMLAAVFEAVANKYRLSWENSARGDLETQRVAHLSLAALKDVIGALRAHIANGKILEADIAAKQKRDAYGA